MGNTDTELKTENFDFNTDRKRKRDAVAGITMMVIIIMVIIVMALTVKPTVNINKYVSLSVSGYDTIAEADYDFDTGAFYLAFGSALNFNENKYSKLDSEDYWWYSDIDTEKNAEANLLDIIESAILIDNSENLSNGDTVTLTLNLTKQDTKALNKLFGCIIRFDDIELTVSGLETAEIYNPFSELVVDFNGTDGNASASVIYSSEQEFADEISFSIDKEDELSNGDIITVSINEEQSDFAEQYGVIIYPLSYEYTVDGLSYPISYYVELSEEGKNELYEKALEQVNEIFDYSFYEGEVSDIGYWFIGSDDYNKLFYVFQIDMPKYSYYTCVWFDYININDDGETGYLDTSITDYLSTQGFSVYLGAETLEELYSYEIEGYLMDYELETDINLEDYVAEEEEAEDENTNTEEEEESEETNDVLEKWSGEAQDLFGELIEELWEAMN